MALREAKVTAVESWKWSDVDDRDKTVRKGQKKRKKTIREGEIQSKRGGRKEGRERGEGTGRFAFYNWPNKDTQLFFSFLFCFLQLPSIIYHFDFFSVASKVRTLRRLSCASGKDHAIDKDWFS